MAEPTKFPEANFTWKGWEADENRNEVLDLPAYRYDNKTISCWKLTWRERLCALFFGKAWLTVIGRQPPVYVSPKCPFIRQGSFWHIAKWCVGMERAESRS